jgi:NAD(P)-dependent dehydrogenase (short-subunit alcohol dehydrogenase family)
VVITGGSRGFGYAMAREFLLLGDSVALCGRDPARLDAALAHLRSEFGAERVAGGPCDCSRAGDVQRFGQLVGEELGGVDLWINNAGEVTAKRLLADVEAEEVARVVGTNVAGSLLGTQQAIRLMRRQPAAEQPVYHVFNLGFSRYGAKVCVWGVRVCTLWCRAFAPRTAASSSAPGHRTLHRRTHRSSGTPSPPPPLRHPPLSCALARSSPSLPSPTRPPSGRWRS